MCASVYCIVHEQFNMKLRGSLLVIVYCLVMEFCNINRIEYLLFKSNMSDRIVFLTGMGLMFLLYPLVGHLTDVYLTRYRSLKWSFAILILVACLTIFCEIIYVALSCIWNLSLHNNKGTIFVFIGLVVYTVGLSLFQANSIQFGLDQLLEAPTPKLIAFIHWYYWAQNVGSLVLFYVMASCGFILEEVSLMTNGAMERLWHGSVYNILYFIAITIAVTAVLIKICRTKKHFYIQKAGLNPFKKMYKVLKYSWKHNVPEHRSAFTYWEEDIPRRIDLGKNKYGGPFTNEEVEDTKTFLRILLLLLCLFVTSQQCWLVQQCWFAGYRLRAHLFTMSLTYYHQHPVCSH